MQHIATINGKQILFLQITQDFKEIYNLEVCNSTNTEIQSLVINHDHDWYDLPAGSWLILGKVDEMTEEQLKQIYPYTEEGYMVESSPEKWVMDFEGAKDYLLTSCGIFLTKPLGEKPALRYSDYDYSFGMSDAKLESIEHDFNMRLADWQEAQERTSKNWIALIQTENK